MRAAKNRRINLRKAKKFLKFHENHLDHGLAVVMNLGQKKYFRTHLRTKLLAKGSLGSSQRGADMPDPVAL